MSFTIGRASLPADPSSARWSGDQLTITGWISPTTANDTNHAYALRQQLLGLVNNPDEQVFPCTFSVDANWDGYYYVNSVSVDGNPSLMEIQGRMPYSITLTKVGPGFARPQVESVYSLITRANAHAIVTPTGVSASWVNPGGYGTESSLIASGSLTCEDGSVSYYSQAAPVTSTSARMFVAAADYYKTAARIEIKYGSTWYPISGYNIPNSTAANWRISNGFTRLYPTSVSGTGRFTVERWNGAAWVGREFGWQVSAGTFNYATADTAAAFSTRITMNSPYAVSIRTFYNYTTYDFTLRQADGFVEVTTTLTPLASTFGFGCSAVVASTAFTGGLRATATDANGLRYLISCPIATTNDLVNGRITATASVSQATFQICPDYLTGVGGGTDTSVRDTFMAMRSERRAVGVR